MRLQLTVFSVILVLAFLIQLLMPRRRMRRGQTFAPAGGVEDAADRLLKACTQALPVYVLLAAVALLMLNFGKPGRFPQWAGWAVVVLETLRWLAQVARSPEGARWIGVVVYLCLIYLWAYQLPLFDMIPY